MRCNMAQYEQLTAFVAAAFFGLGAAAFAFAIFGFVSLASLASFLGLGAALEAALGLAAGVFFTVTFVGFAAAAGFFSFFSALGFGAAGLGCFLASLVPPELPGEG
jgi:hypothetical protein